MSKIRLKNRKSGAIVLRSPPGEKGDAPPKRKLARKLPPPPVTESEKEARMRYHANVVHRGMATDTREDYVDSQFDRPPPAKLPVRSVLLAFFLFMAGTVLLTFAILGMTGKIENFGDRIFPMLLLGLMTFIPGAYHTRVFIQALRGVPGYSYEDIPEWE